VKTLEQIIQDKITQIASLENDLTLAHGDTKQVQQALDERVAMLE
jgi:hypothetical protein